MTEKPKHPLAAYREAKNVRPSVAAKELAISRQSLFRIENGDQTPSVELIKRIVAFTDGKVSASDLVEAA
jgi:DNA-binding XRE family transcriptional regulator